MEHVAKDGTFKTVDSCTLPITGVGVVDRIINALCVFDVTEGWLVLRELAPEITIDYVRERTGPSFRVALSITSTPTTY